MFDLEETKECHTLDRKETSSFTLQALKKLTTCKQCPTNTDGLNIEALYIASMQ